MVVLEADQTLGVPLPRASWHEAVPDMIGLFLVHAEPLKRLDVDAGRTEEPDNRALVFEHLFVVATPRREELGGVLADQCEGGLEASVLPCGSCDSVDARSSCMRSGPRRRRKCSLRALSESLATLGRVTLSSLISPCYSPLYRRLLRRAYYSRLELAIPLYARCPPLAGV